MSVFAALLFVMPHSVSSVYAATNTSAEYKTKGILINTHGDFIAAGPPENFYTVTMYSTNVSGMGTINSGAVIDWSYVTIKVNSINKIRAHTGFLWNNL